MVDQDGHEEPVMHACGHDMHLTCLLTASDILARAKDRWRGTLIVLFQPNKEHTGGAQAMLNDGLYDKIPVPDVIFGQRLIPQREGTVHIRPGPILTGADTFHIHINSKGEQSINPQRAINPIKVLNSIVLKLENALKEITSSGEYADITPEEFHAGHPGLDALYEAQLVLDVKCYSYSVRHRLLEKIRSIAKAECKAAGIPNVPSIKVKVRAPVTENNHEVVASVKETFVKVFGRGVSDGEPRTACEDFSLLARSKGIPYAYWFIGSVDAATWDEAIRQETIDKQVPENHSPFYAPKILPSFAYGVGTLSLAALIYLAKD